VTAPAPAPTLELRQIQKRFGSVQALRGADFTLGPGEVHALLGENGAGKTTLMHVAYGLVRADAGEVVVGGVSRAVTSPRSARRVGVGMVHQHFTSIPALSVAENVALAAGWPVTPEPLRRRVRALGDRVGLPLDPDLLAGRLSVSLKQRLEIVKALAADARILLLDEPTAVLAPTEADDLLRVMRAFAETGGSVVLITHKLDEALTAADRVTVLRQGSVVFTGPVTGQTTASLARAMMGDASQVGAPAEITVVSPSPPEGSGVPGPALVQLDSLEVPRESGFGIAVRHASLVVHGGEILGVAGVEGNGQRELLRAVAGRLLPIRGKLEVAGPVAFIPEDRTTEGLIPELTLTENVVLGSRPGDPWLGRGRIDWGVARQRTAALLREFGVVAPGTQARAAELSGGNQQKLVAARELARAPRVIVAEDPTRGLDIRAAAEIHARLIAAAGAGAAVVVHSSDLDEVLRLAHRVVVMARGALRPVAPGATRAQISELMVAGAR
jgi:general nucleoside transport system ATP-binding protein